MAEEVYDYSTKIPLLWVLALISITILFDLCHVEMTNMRHAEFYSCAALYLLGVET